MLDPAAVAALAGPRLAPAALVDVRLRQLDYRPRVRATIRYELRLRSAGTATTLDAVATVEPSGTELRLFPDDAGLGGLALLGDPAALARRLGVESGPVEVLAWVPGLRATVRMGASVLKFYDSSDHAAAAVDALRRVETVVPTGALLGWDADAAIVAQRRVEGRPLERADAVASAAEAARLVRTLHRWDAGDEPLADGSPAALVAKLGGPVELIGFARPDLGERLAAVRDRLHGTLPAPARLVPSHGDYNLGQLLRGTDGSLHVVDLDTLCLADPALDLASYASNVVSGREGDVEAAVALLDQLRLAYGDDTGALAWHFGAGVLRRVDRAIRRTKKRWGERTERLVAAAEATVERLES